MECTTRYFVDFDYLVIFSRVDMDAQYPFASRDDIWRVLDELKELQVAQYEQGERLARLERRREDDSRLRSVWSGPSSPFPTLVASSIPAGKCADPHDVSIAFD